MHILPEYPPEVLANLVHSLNLCLRQYRSGGPAKAIYIPCGHQLAEFFPTEST